jgi:carbonic anhydrase
MDFLDVMLARNAEFAATAFLPALKILPSTGTIIIGCVDPRVDPVAVLGLRQGEAAVIRNVGGRVDKPLMGTLAILKVVAKASGGPGGVRNLVLLHHTDCGIIGCYHHAPDLLARSFGVDVTELDALEITDPHKSVRRDILALQANDQLQAGIIVTGLVYDVTTGLVETVVPPAPLRPQAQAA